MGLKKKRSARERAVKKRSELRQRTLRRFALSVLGLLGMSTVLGLALLAGGGETKSSRPTYLAHKTSTVTVAPKQPSLVGEEYPKEDRVGFGLEDLIEKTRKRAKGKNESPSTKATPKKSSSPELVLIIDDVSQPRQLAAIRKLPFPVTPSIFPPSQMNKHTPKLAKGLRHYMIHFPLESGSKKMNRFEKTLFVRDDPAKVRKRVEEIRHLFPSARFLNNHTGSVFTSNYRAMYRLYGFLKKEGFIFLDSRTSGHSKVRKIAAEYHMPYLGRDVFLDNVQIPQAVRTQLKRAVRLAKKRGYAIAIGHPHPVTLRVLKQAASLLKGVKAVYLDDFYREHYGR
ncbi:divergent polysaccharide deacetylase family protein [Nitratifractor salsuginis]|uniref:Divergent polysaccharide deacetylase family protein n=1 Tax=Nitratifractor salsuginis (strain DSM 16511 / JCM 12458 / E9I37-1) TaxID=749222 RepID=E6WZZ2_NITSE|nr:divergent polysaccharide deacetylase family protein [Nitratifractor salsuginis]ADV45650.1 protein of unknown function DUF610 YibQ [Nitratifractor salsuginis DSM 16511]